MINPPPPPTFPVPPDGPWIDAWLASPRFGRYLNETGGDRGRAVALYEWNAQVSAACQRDLAHLEVGLRNAYDLAATGWGGSGHWLLDGHQTVFAPLPQTRNGRPVDVNRRPREQVEKAIRDAGGATRSTPGKVVAQLTFGFWRYLSTKAHEKTVWVPYLYRAFPTGTDRTNVDAIAGRLHNLRNRVAHHEHLLNEDLAARHTDVLALTDLIEPTLSTYLNDSSTLPRLLAVRP